MNKKILSIILPTLLIILINIIGWIGVAMIVYGWLIFFLRSVWPLLEQIEDKIIYLGNLLTIFCVMLVTISIYLPQNKRPPENISKFGTAPIIILSCIFTLILIFFFNYKPDLILINGYALLAISGTLFRLISRWNVNAIKIKKQEKR